MRERQEELWYGGELPTAPRGGRARGRNWRACQRAASAEALPMARPEGLPLEATAQAIATLDAQFPWLCRAEQRTPRRP